MTTKAKSKPKGRQFEVCQLHPLYHFNDASEDEAPRMVTTGTYKDAGACSGRSAIFNDERYPENGTIRTYDKGTDAYYNDPEMKIPGDHFIWNGRWFSIAYVPMSENDMQPDDPHFKRAR